MGDGGSDVGYVSVPVCRLRQCNFGLVFWCDFGIFLDICSDICFNYFSIFTYVYECEHHHEISYKAPISGKGVMSLCGPIVMLLCWLAFQ